MIIFDEVKYAENVLRNGCSRKYILVDFKILAKYFLMHKGYGEEKTLEEMLKILKEKQSIIPINFLPQKIQASIKYAKTEQLRKSEPIGITEEEVILIDSLPDNLRELAFVYLFLMKWNNSEDGFFIDKGDLKKLIKCPNITNTKLNILDGELERTGFIEFIDYCRKEKIKVKTIGENNIIFVKDFENVLLYYRQYCGARVVLCEDCGCLVETKSNRQKYCKVCAKKHKLKQNKESRERLVKTCM